jgi:hypothetical protein
VLAEPAAVVRGGVEVANACVVGSDDRRERVAAGFMIDVESGRG